MRRRRPAEAAADFRPRVGVIGEVEKHVVREADSRVPCVSKLRIHIAFYYMFAACALRFVEGLIHYGIDDENPIFRVRADG